MGANENGKWRAGAEEDHVEQSGNRDEECRSGARGGK